MDEARKLRHELENIYMLARMKRTIVYRYPEGKPARQIGPASNDEDWDRVIEHCERVGLKPLTIRPVSSKPD